MRPRLVTALCLALLVAGAPAAGAHEAPQAVRLPARSAVPGVTAERFELVVPAVGAGLAATVPDAGAVAPDAADADPVLADEPAAGGRVETPVVEAAGFQTVGLTWPLGADAAGLEPQVRVRADGTWSPWRHLEADPHEPTSGTADAAARRGGTDALWVGEADAVQVSFAARPVGGPAGMQLVLIDAGAAQPTGATATLQAVPGAPTVVSRESWGARAQACAPDVATELKGAVVHHTAGADYTTQAQAMQQIRADQAFHIDEKGWCDIGYNFVVDKWGTIYEGRDNSLTRPVIGAHTPGANTGTVGVAMLGTFTSASPSTAAQQAVGQVIGWRLGAYGLDPLSETTYVAAEGSRDPAGTVVTKPRVMGHRDMAATECPGNAGYPNLPAIRTAAATTAALPGIPADGPFSDVSAANPFLADIAWLKASGITTGYPDDTFRPTGSVTREAMAAFLYRFAHGTDEPLPTCAAGPRRFSDVPAGHPFCGAIEALAADGVLGGWSDGTYRPGEAVTRQAMAAFLYRFASGSSAVPACTGADRAFTDVPAGDPFCGAVEWLATTGVTTGWPDRTFRPSLSITREAMAAFLHRLDTYLA